MDKLLIEQSGNHHEINSDLNHSEIEARVGNATNRLDNQSVNDGQVCIYNLLTY